jgi:hypothetical protein
MAMIKNNQAIMDKRSAGRKMAADKLDKLAAKK